MFVFDLLYLTQLCFNFCVQFCKYSSIKMYHGRHAFYRMKLCHRYSGRHLPSLSGTEQSHEYAIRFYKWFYAQIQPCGCQDMVYVPWMRRLEILYCRDLRRLYQKTIKIEGALSSLCEIRGLFPTDAWKSFLLRWNDGYSIPTPYARQLQYWEPPYRRFSLRIARIDPFVFGFHGNYSSPCLGCMRCEHRNIGCDFCFGHNKLTYQEAAYKNLGVVLKNHSKCRGKGCRLCYNRARKSVRARNIRAGVYPSLAQKYGDWYNSTQRAS